MCSSSVREPAALTSEVKHKKNKEVNIIDPNPNNNYKTKKHFADFYTEVIPFSCEAVTCNEH